MDPQPPTQPERPPASEAAAEPTRSAPADSGGAQRWAVRVALAMIVGLQALLGLAGLGNYWQWGHNGFNSAAYQLAAKNTLRWGILLPAQYSAGSIEPGPNALYTHAPLGLHLHTTASVALFGDHNAAVRLVPALNGVLAALMLIVVVRRFWGDRAAILAGLIYVLLPINHAFANMTNHSTGFIFWALAMLYAYLRWLEQVPGHPGLSRRPWLWIAGLFGACFMATQWDWPAYYVAFAIAAHWFYASFDADRRALPHRFGVLNREHALLAAFCVFVLANFFGFFIMVWALVGSFDEIKASFSSRHGTPPGAYGRLAKEVFAPMYSLPVLATALAWVVGLLVRHARGVAEHRDLIPFAFAFAGVVHVWVFKSTALIHIYWSWPLNPFMAIAATLTLLALARWGSTAAALAWERLTSASAAPRGVLLAAASALVLGVFGGTYLSHTVPMIAEGRRVAGTFNHPGYKREYLKILFSEKVRAWTTLSTGVMFLRNMPHRVEVVATLDRAQAWASRPDRISPPRHLTLDDGWVVIGAVRQTPRAQLLRAAAKHPFRQYGLYFMVDHRKDGQDIQIWDLVPDEPAPLTWQLWVNPFDPPMRAVRNTAAEDAMRREIKALPAKRTPARRAPARPHKGALKTTPSPRDLQDRVVAPSLRGNGAPKRPKTTKPTGKAP